MSLQGDPPERPNVRMAEAQDQVKGDFIPLTKANVTATMWTVSYTPDKTWLFPCRLHDLCNVLKH